MLPCTIAPLLEFAQQDLHEVEGHEADADGDGPFDPVHAQALVEAADHALLPHDLPHGARDAAVGVSGDPRRLHASAHHVQRVRGRLTDQSCARTERQTLVRERLRATRVL